MATFIIYAVHNVLQGDQRKTNAFCALLWVNDAINIPCRRNKVRNMQLVGINFKGHMTA